MNPKTPGLSAELLTRDDLRRALIEHDFAAAFRLIKKYGGISQNRIAAVCMLTPGKVSTIISGQQQITSFDVVCRISDGLRIPGSMLGLAARSWEADSEPHENEPPTPPVDHSEETPWHMGVTVDLATRLTKSDLMMDRRTITRALTSAGLSGSGLLNSLEGWLQPAGSGGTARRQGRLGSREIDELEAITRVFRQWNHQVGGALHRKAVLGQLNEVASTLKERQTSTIERRLLRVMAKLAGTAATMAWDSGMQQRAQDYYRLALRAAHAGHDLAFGANVLAGMARQMVYRGHPRDALELVRLAQDGSRGKIGPRVTAMLHTREAWAYAGMGRTQAFQRATGQAAEALSNAQPEEEPYWIAYFTEAELAGVTGGRLLDLARNEPQRHAQPAAEHIQRALETRNPDAGRSHALDRIGLAECSFLMGDITAAAEHTHEAVEAAAQTQSNRVRDQLADLYPYTVGHSASSAVREARGRIRELLAN